MGHQPSILHEVGHIFSQIITQAFYTLSKIIFEIVFLKHMGKCVFGKIMKIKKYKLNN